MMTPEQLQDFRDRISPPVPAAVRDQVVRQASSQTPLPAAALARAYRVLTREGANDICQRWKDRRDFYRSGADGRFGTAVKSRYGVELEYAPGSFKAVSQFIRDNHYLHAKPQLRVAFSLYYYDSPCRRRRVGVAVFSNGPRQTKGQPSLFGGVGHLEIVELSRFILLPEVPANGEVWFLRRCFPLLQEVLRQRGDLLRVVISFSDPIPRRNAQGELTMPGHIGNIYQAGGATYVRPSSPKEMLLDALGRTFDPRTLSKIRSLDSHRRTESGAEKAVLRFELFLSESAPDWWAKHGAKKRRENYRQWVKRAQAASGMRLIDHPGNLTYVWTFGHSDHQNRKLRRAGTGGGRAGTLPEDAVRVSPPLGRRGAVRPPRHLEDARALDVPQEAGPDVYRSILVVLPSLVQGRRGRSEYHGGHPPADLE